MKNGFKKYIAYIAVSGAYLLIIGCRGFLNEKPDQRLATISSLQDLQALLDHEAYVNTFDPNCAEESSDNYYLTYTDWSSFEEFSRNMYIWENNSFSTTSYNDWSYLYDNVYRANTILTEIDKLSRTDGNQGDWDNIKGQGYFLRAKSFLKAVEIWSLAYDSVTAGTDMGIPLKLGTDFNQRSVRSTVQQTFDQVVSDLRSAISLLPIKASHVLRSSKPAAYAMLARAYLNMRKYDEAGKCADSCLQLYDNLLNYNSLNASETFPIDRFNVEVIYASYMNQTRVLHATSGRIDSILYQSYEDNDLRKDIFFTDNEDGSFSFRGSYDGSYNLFSGIATDEVILTRAECYARQGRIEEAMRDLNALLSNRYKKEMFTDLKANSLTEALNLILTERRKELLMRGIRWADIKRLNKEGLNIQLKRSLNGQIYSLQPNDRKFALPIPENVISLSGMPQNPR